MKLKAGIINVTGYAGAEVARILHNHPKIAVVSATGRTHAGKMLCELFPHLSGTKIRIGTTLDSSLDCVFSALPHTVSAQALKPFIASGLPCVDISADFRIKDPLTYKKWYGVQHNDPKALKESVYGLPEFSKQRKKDIASSKIVANPGCFPTGAILGLVPALTHNIIDSHIINDSKTGISGAGRTAKIDYGFSELNNNCRSYALDGHRHKPEIEQELSLVAYKNNVNITFVPTLVPMTRGILGTSYAKFKSDISALDVQKLYTEYYQQEPFIRVVNEPPSTKQVFGSNELHIYVTVDSSSGVLVSITALDNLVKGAAGSAVQNMNLMLGFEESLSLQYLPIFP